MDGLMAFTAGFEKAVVERLDDDGFFDPAVVEAPYEAPNGVWALFERFQEWVGRVRRREVVRMRGAGWEGVERGVLVGKQVGGGGGGGF